MAARQMKGAWWVDFRFEGERYRRKSPVDTKRGAEEYERKIRKQIQDGTFEVEALPTFEMWFTERFWREWVVGRKNKPSEAQEKRAIFELHLKPHFGDLPLDEIDAGCIARFRASLVERTVRRAGGEERPLSEKRMNNILAVLSKALRYAEEVQLIDRAPRVALFRLERPEIEWWEFSEYARVLAAAKAHSAEWYAGVCLAGEAGLRVGEVKALRWREDVDMVGRTVTVNQQIRQGTIGTPKGRTRRTIPMTTTLYEALAALSVVRTGYVLRNADGSPKTDEQARYNLDSIYVKAGLPSKGWHILRHSFGTHAALLGVNPWRLQAWMGHKRIDETMRYVHVAESHGREIPEPVLEAGSREKHPDRRIIAMLGSRGHQMGTSGVGEEKNEVVSAG